jgi:hypothetical protein
MKNLKKYYLLIASISLLGLSGCTPASQYLSTPTKMATNTVTQYESPTPRKSALYQQTMRSVASGIKHDTKYQRIALDTTEKKEWFKTLTYRLWDRQITRHQFMAEGLAKYPSRRYEFQFVIDGFANVCG